MSQHFSNLHSLFWLFLHDFQNKVFSFISCINVLREFDLVFNDSIQVQLRVNTERNLTKETFVSHHSNVPNINFFIILDTHNDFRWVIKRTSNWGGFSHSMTFVDCPSKITNLCNSEIEQNIFWLYVSMDYQLFVNVINSFNDLPDVSANLRFFHSSIFPQHF